MKTFNFHRLFFRVAPVFVLLLSACAVLGRGGEWIVTHHDSENVFKVAKTLPVKIKSIVVLPLAFDAASSDLSSGGEMLDPVLDAELLRTEKFQVVRADTETLRRSFGNWNWTGTEELPTNFLGGLQEIYGADAVLFCQLTEFRAYAPLAVGWRLKLVDARTKKILWAADEIFDAQDPATATRAEMFRQYRPLSFIDRNDKWMALNSPLDFGRFTIATLLNTLPER